MKLLRSLANNPVIGNSGRAESALIAVSLSAEKQTESPLLKPMSVPPGLSEGDVLCFLDFWRAPAYTFYRLKTEIGA